jgi:hypothetical protein
VVAGVGSDVVGAGRGRRRPTGGGRGTRLVRFLFF